MDATARTLAVVAIALIVILGAGQAVANTSELPFVIDKGPIESVFYEFSLQANLQFGADYDDADGREIGELGPFVGRATADEALSILLADTYLWYTWLDKDTIRVSASIIGPGPEALEVPSVPRGPHARLSWRMPPVTAETARDILFAQTGVKYDIGAFGKLIVGPLADEKPRTGEDIWIELIKPYCDVVRIRRNDNVEAGSVVDPNGFGNAVHDFDVDAMSRAHAIEQIALQADRQFGQEAFPAQDREVVGPIRGRMTVNDAVRLALRGSDLYMRWESSGAWIVPTSTVTAYADMRKCLHHFGFPQMTSLGREHVIVTESRLASLQDFVQGQVATYGRKDIEATGASSIPDFLRYATQFPYMRSKGYRLSGAQYAEVRGLEPQYTLVLINGTRADVSASDLTASAFDLNTVPISAVERIEISAGSPSLVHGMDAIGGMVNIVLRDNVTNPFADVRYGSARGGARERIGTVAAGTSADRGKTAFFLDYFELSQLLGNQRERWRDMDYTRFGGPDRRWRYAAPPNVYSLDGQDLPGLGAPDAAVSILPSGDIAFRPGETNMASSLAMRAIVPAMRRMSLTGTAEMHLGSSKLSSEALFVHRNVHFEMDADIVPGYTMAAGHPQNPFDTPVSIDAALVGLPPRATDTRSELLRGVVKLAGPLGKWRYHSFMRYSREQASAARVNFLDATAVMNGLASSGPDALSIFTARPGEFAAASIFAPRQSSSAEAGGTQVSARIDGTLPLFQVATTLGVEHRTETARFDTQVGQVQRNEGSAFGIASIPIGERLDVTYGTRIDDFRDLEQIRREQWGFSWRPAPGIEFRAAYNEAFHPPSLSDLHLPRITSPVPLFDARRQEVTLVDFVTGGNPNLAPTTGFSSNLAVTLETDNAFKASVELWRVRMRDHISPLAPLALLANESDAIAGRILRDEPTALDGQTGRPGRLLALDATRANLGKVDTRGVDLSMQKSFETSVGTFVPRLDLTYTDAFRYNDLPIRDAPMRDRAGIASVLGTIASWRGTCSLSYAGYGWQLNVFGRYHSSYNDYSVATSTISDREIPSRVVWDFTISKDLGGHIELTIGVSDLLNRAPPYAEVSDPVGFDTSQADLAGRTAFIQVNGSM